VIRVVLPTHLKRLAKVDGELTIEVDGTPSADAIVDAIEALHPQLRGTIRDHVTRKRRAYVRYFACGEDLSHDPSDQPLPDAVASGAEPFRIVGAMAGG
jgi:molybdopterin synthase sulfur carrier subunit